MTLHEEAFARYHETHEGHVNVQGSERLGWAKGFFHRNFMNHLPLGFHDVLEIACGSGDMMAVFREFGCHVLGTDLDPHNIRDGVLLRDVFKEPLSRQFGVIVMMGIIEHIRKDDLLPSLRNVRSMLAPGGVVFITTQNMDSPMGDHFRYLDITHELGFTRESLCQVARLAGFTPEVYPMLYAPPLEPGWKGVIARLYRRLYRTHVKLVGGAMQGTWWDCDGLLGVWRAD